MLGSEEAGRSSKRMSPSFRQPVAASDVFGATVGQPDDEGVAPTKPSNHGADENRSMPVMRAPCFFAFINT